MLTTQQHADLAADSYNDLAVGKDPIGEDKTLKIGGVDYKILYHASNPTTDYQGTVYQAPNGEIIVAHRGTSSLKDVDVDLGMVKNRANMQTPDALALTEWAINEAKRQQRVYDLPQTPTVTLTGHSLGGALTEVSAYKYNLKGETFNGYGAANLDGMPKNAGHGQVTTHVIATDAVSAGGDHFGDVKIYARPQDIAMLGMAGYGKNNPLEERPKTLAVASAGMSHSSSFFTGKDSVLNDPQAQQRSQNHATAINEYRKDVHDDRAIVQATIEGLQTGSHKAQQAMQQLQSVAQKVTTTVEHKTQQATTAVTQATQHATTVVEHKAQQALEAAKHTAQHVAAVAEHTTQQLKDTAKQAVTTVENKVSEAGTAVNDTLNSAGQSIKNFFNNLPSVAPETPSRGGWKSSDASKYLPAAHALQASATEKVQELYLNQGFDFNSQSGEAYAKAAATLAAKHNMPSIDFISHDGQNLHIAFYSKDALNIPTFASINTQEVFTQGQTADAHTLAATMQHNETQAQAQREARTPEQSHARSMSA